MFLKVDLKVVCHEMEVKESNTEKTVFQLLLGHYEHVVMPFGLQKCSNNFYDFDEYLVSLTFG